jgi:hypothetical protein
MTTVLEKETSSTVPQGSNRQGLIFEHSKRGRRGYRLPALDVPEQTELIPKGLMRDKIADEVEVSEVDVIRHFTRLESECLDRRRLYPPRFVHDEAQPAAQRGDRAHAVALSAAAGTSGAGQFDCFGISSRRSGDLGMRASRCSLSRARTASSLAS